jgi:hypothetical protein
VNNYSSFKYIISVFFCIFSIVACQREPTTLTQENIDIPSEVTIENPVTNANADVTFVRAERATEGSWTFFVTVQHPDTSWEDYADGWDIVLPDGEVIKPDPDSEFTRTLLHPHIDEQPFTRSQSKIKIPPDVTTIRVRAHDLVDGFGGEEIVIDITIKSGPGFEIIGN